ncbi:MAG TPA: FHA domain-containing protein [bacterium]|nr:FHA domain-containing protein [bacterium]
MGLKLVVENDRNELSVHGFATDLITVGRATDNDLVLPERNVSRHHFQLELIDDRIVVEDRGSYNATYVNAKELQRKVEIFVGDIITVGDYNIYLERDEEEEGPAKTREIENVVRVAETEVLLAKNGAIGGRAFAVKGAETVIGSHAGADVYLFHPDIPDVYAKIIFDGNIYLLISGTRDKNYPLVVNGMEVQSIDLRHGDEVKIGEFLFDYIEKGNQYSPYEYLVAAEEERRRKLREEIEGKKIKTLRDEDEVTEVTKQVEKTRRVQRGRRNLLLLLVVIIALILAVVILFKGGYLNGILPGMEQTAGDGQGQ